MAKLIIAVKNKSRISLVKLVTIISVIISSNKGNHFWSRSSRRVASFGIYLWNFIATFGGGCYFGKFTVGWDYLRKSLKTGTSRSALQGNRCSVTTAGHGVLTTCWSPGQGGGCRECYSLWRPIQFSVSYHLSVHGILFIGFGYMWKSRNFTR